MSNREDFLLEIHTEELPAKPLLKLAQNLAQGIQAGIEKAGFAFHTLHYFATPRRLAVSVTKLAFGQADQVVERKGPALLAAFNANGEPTPACLGFANSCGVSPQDLITLKTPQGEWVGFRQTVAGKTVHKAIFNIALK